jgi:hypothetical protein
MTQLGPAAPSAWPVGRAGPQRLRGGCAGQRRAIRRGAQAARRRRGSAGSSRSGRHRGRRCAGLLRLTLVRLHRSAVHIAGNWRLPPRLSRPQGEAREVGLASVPGSACTLGRRQHPIWVDLALEALQQRATCRGCPRTGIVRVGPGLVRGKPRDQGAVGRHGNEGAFASPVHLRRASSPDHSLRGGCIPCLIPLRTARPGRHPPGRFFSSSPVIRRCVGLDHR